MGIRKVGGIGTRKGPNGAADVANLGESAKFISCYVYCDDGHTASYTINKGDALVMESAATAARHVSIAGVATDVLTYFGFSGVARPLDFHGRVSTSNGLGGAIGAATDLPFVFGIAAETVTVAADSFQLISVQVWGLCEDVNVASGVAIGERLVAETADADSSVGRLQDIDGLVDGTAAGDIEELGEAAIVGIALSAASSNKADVWLLDPLQLAN